MTGCIQIFAKAPIPGLAKSRLIPAIGAEGAAHLQALFIHHTLASTAQMQLPTELWCTPDTKHPSFIAAARDFSVYLHQQEGDGLGERMNHALTEGLSRGGPVVLIGTDCPMLSADDLHEAFDALSNGHDAVLGPSADGGYFLIGLNQPQPKLFDGMTWSTSGVLNETCTRLHSANLRWHELRTLHDIDTPADLIHLPNTLKQEVPL